MQCKECKTQMFKHTLTENDHEGDIEVRIIFKCPNPICTLYGYKNIAIDHENVI